MVDGWEKRVGQAGIHPQILAIIDENKWMLKQMRWDANHQEKRATREQRRRKEAKLRQGLNHPPKYLSSPNSTHSQLPGPQPTEFTQYDHETLEPGSVGAQLKAQHDLNGNTFSSVQPMNCNDWNNTPPKSAKQVKEEYLRSQKKPWV